MIERYTHPEMGHIWTLENEFRTMLQVEILACEAMNKLGIVPDDALKDIQTKADFRIERIKEIEAVTNHDIIAFLQKYRVPSNHRCGCRYGQPYPYSRGQYRLWSYRSYYSPKLLPAVHPDGHGKAAPHAHGQK
jgi:hypothetical protein